MSFKSKAQQRFMYATKPEGVDLKEWSKETDFSKLPEKAKKRKEAMKKEALSEKEIINTIKSKLGISENEASDLALKAGLLTGATYSGYKGARNYLIDLIEGRTPSLSMEDVYKKIRPGDLVVSRVNPVDSAEIALGEMLPENIKKKKLPRLDKNKLLSSIKNKNKGNLSDIAKGIKGSITYDDISKIKSPVKANQIIQLLTGNPFSHASMKLQHGGDLLNVAMGQNSFIEDLGKSLGHSEFKIYRPKVKEEALSKAINAVGGQVGRPYMSNKEMGKFGLGTLFSPFKKKTSLSNLCKGQTCSTTLANALNDVFKNQYSFFDDIRKSNNLEFIGRYGSGFRNPLGETIRNYVAHPILSSLKYALPAAGLAYGGKKLYDYIKD